MGVLINHTIGFLTSPLAVTVGLAVLGLILMRKWRRLGTSAVALSLVWLYCMSSGWMFGLLGLGLEREFPPVRAEALPQADAIVVLGGGIEAQTNVAYYAELYGAADRIVHAARIWRAGKAPVVIPSGANELQASRPLLKEFGVPESAILVENDSRNTEENARFVAAYVKKHHEQNGTNFTVRLSLPPQPKILLVTSAWHMRRSLLMFRKYAPGVEVVPAACDHEATVAFAEIKPEIVLPSADTLARNSAMLKEYIGYWGYRLLR